jgi:hypothetical protein
MVVSNVNVINYSHTLRDTQLINRCIEAMKARYGTFKGHISPEYNQESSADEDVPSTSDDNIV